MKEKPSSEDLQIAADPSLFVVRGQRVILDEELARIYGIPTGQFNQAIRRNLSRFPKDFAFQLTREEAETLLSQIVISKIHPVTELHELRGGRRSLPWAFTEHGALMAANILRGERAERMSVFVVRAFIRMREQISTQRTLLDRLAEIDEKLLDHDEALRDVYEKLLYLLDPPADPTPKRTMGLRKEDG